MAVVSLQSKRQKNAAKNKKGKKGGGTIDDLKQELVLDEHMIAIEELMQRLGTSTTSVSVFPSAIAGQRAA